MRRLFLVLLALLVVPFALAATPNPGHDASSIGNGTFSAGNYAFPQNVSVVGNISAGQIIYTPQLCLNGNCQTSWPSGTGVGGGWTNNSQNTTTTLNVGIGTTRPNSTLHVAGTGNFTSTLYANNGFTLSSGTLALPAGSISTAMLADGAVTSLKHADASINATKLNTSNTGSTGLVLTYNSTGGLNWSSAAGGSVTSVGFVVNGTSAFSVYNSPVTSSGNLQINFQNASGSQDGILKSVDWTTFNNAATLANAYYTNISNLQNSNASAFVAINTLNASDQSRGNWTADKPSYSTTANNNIMYQARFGTGIANRVLVWTNSTNASAYLVNATMLNISTLGSAGQVLALNSTFGLNWITPGASSAGGGWTNTTLLVSLSNSANNISGGTFFVDNTNSKVGVGNNQPNVSLEVSGAGRFLNTLTATNGFTLSSGTLTLPSGSITNGMLASNSVANQNIFDAAVNASKLNATNTAVGGQYLTYGANGQFTWMTLPASSGGNLTGGLGTTLGNVAFWNNGSMINGSSGLFWDNANGRLGIGTIAPSSALSVVGTGTQAAPGSLTVSGTNTSEGEAQIVISQIPGGSDFKLLVAGEDVRTDGLTANDQYAIAGQRLNLASRGNNVTAMNTRISLGTSGTASYGDITFATAIPGVNGTERMRIDSTGNVGIGTSAPNNTLTVAGTGNFTSTLYANNGFTLSSGTLTLPTGSISTAMIADGAVTSLKHLDSSINATKFNTSNAPATGQVLMYNSTGGLNWSSAAGGSVTSVGFVVNGTSAFSVYNSPVTSSGNLQINFQNASGSQDGLLKSVDWTTFNNAATLASAYYTNISNLQNSNASAFVAINTLNASDQSRGNWTADKPSYSTTANNNIMYQAQMGPGVANRVVVWSNTTNASAYLINATMLNISTLGSAGQVLTINSTFGLNWSSTSTGTVSSVAQAVTGTTAVTVSGSPVTTSGTLSLAFVNATTSQDGLLKSADWNTFNNAATLANGYYTNISNLQNSNASAFVAINTLNASVQSIGNWTNDKTSYSTTANNNIMYQARFGTGVANQVLVWSNTTNASAYLVNSTFLNSTNTAVGGQYLTYGSAGQFTWTTLPASSGGNITGGLGTTLGNVAFWNNGSMINGTTNLFWDNANARVGIGTTQPNSTLHVVGTGNFTSTLYANNGFTLSSGTLTLPTGSISTAMIADGAVTSLKHLDSSINATKFNTSNTATAGQVLTYNSTGGLNWSSTSTGTVSSVAQAVTGTTAVTVSGSPVTTSGTLSLAFVNATTSQDGLLKSADWNTFNNGASLATGEYTNISNLQNSNASAFVAINALNASDISRGNWTADKPSYSTTANNNIMYQAQMGPGVANRVVVWSNTTNASAYLINATMLNISTLGSAGQVLTINSTFGLNWSSTSTGTVTSVGFVVNGTSAFSVYNSPVTSSGNLQINFQNASGSQDGLLKSVDWTTFNNAATLAGAYYTNISNLQNSNASAFVAINTLNASDQSRGNWTADKPSYSTTANNNIMYQAQMGPGVANRVVVWSNTTNASAYLINATMLNISTLGSAGQVLTINSTFGLNWSSTSTGTVSSVAQAVTGTTAVTVSGSPVTTSGTLSLAFVNATTSQDGLLKSADWNTFNNAATLANGYYTNISNLQNSNASAFVAINTLNASVQSIGNWTNDKTSYSTTANNNIMYQARFGTGVANQVLVWSNTTNASAYLVNSTFLNSTNTAVGGQYLTYGSAGQFTWTTLPASSGGNITGGLGTTLGNVAFWNNGSMINGTTNLFWDNANARVGIGTTQPNSTLHVVGTGNFTSTLYANNGFTLSSGTLALPAGSISTAMIADGAVTSLKHLDSSINATKFNTSNTATAGQVLTYNSTGGLNWSSTSTGTVSSVAQAVTGTTAVTVSGSPVTTSGTLSLAFVNATTSQDGLLKSADWNTFNNGASLATGEYTNISNLQNSNASAFVAINALNASDISRGNWTADKPSYSTTANNNIMYQAQMGPGVANRVVVWSNTTNASAYLVNATMLNISALGSAGQVLTINSTFGLNWSSTSTGTVTSVGFVVNGTSAFSVYNSPVTSSGNLQINFRNASGSQDGLLKSVDWTTFNNAATLAGAYYTNISNLQNSNASAFVAINTLNASVQSIGNWTNDKTSYSTTANNNIMYQARFGTGVANQVLVWTNSTNASAYLVNATMLNISALGSAGQVLTINSTFGLNWSSTSTGTVSSVAQAVTGTTAVTVSGSPVTTSGTLSLAFVNATTSQDGLLKSADWNTFNNAATLANGYYTNISNLQNSNASAFVAINTLNASVQSIGNWTNDKTSIYTNISNLQNSNASAFVAINALNASDISRGNWTADKPNYALITYVQSAGNWTADKPSYTTSANLVTALGNWSLDKSSYSTTANNNIMYQARFGTGVANQVLVWSNATNASAYLINATMLNISTLGSAGQVLMINSTFGLNWSSIAGGSVTSVAQAVTGTTAVTVSGSPVTTSGTLSLAFVNATTSQDGLLKSVDWTTFNNGASLATALYTNVTNLQTGSFTNFSNLQNSNASAFVAISTNNKSIISIGNWTADKPNYALITYVQSAGNWTADKPSYTTSANLVTALGNWSADKSSYSTTTVANGLYAPIATTWTNITQLQLQTSTLNASDISRGNWTADKPNYALITYVQSAGNWTADKPSYSTTANNNIMYQAQMGPGVANRVVVWSNTTNASAYLVNSTFINSTNAASAGQYLTYGASSNGQFTWTTLSSSIGNLTGGLGTTLGNVAFWNNGSMINGTTNLFWDNANSRLGIGTNAPNAALHVVGNINVTGNLLYGGNLTGYGADFAEKLMPLEPVAPGDIVCLAGGFTVRKCATHADTAIAGVVSTHATITGNEQNAPNGVPVGIVGILPTHVIGPVAVGDRITTSVKPGYGEKATAVDSGALIGKAMDACASDTCTINVLVSLK